MTIEPPEPSPPAIRPSDDDDDDQLSPIGGDWPSLASYLGAVVVIIIVVVALAFRA